MRPPQATVGGMLFFIALAALALGVASQPWEQTEITLLSFGVVALPSYAVALLYGPDSVRAASLRILRALAKVSIAVLSVAALALALVVAGGVAVTVFQILTLATVRFAPDLVIRAGVLATLFAVLAAATFAVVPIPGRSRAFTLGFALFGLPYLVAALAPTAGYRPPPLLTTGVLHELYPCLFLFGSPPASPVEPTLVGGPTEYRRFLILGHCVIGLLSATCGGLFAQALAARCAVARPSDVVSRQSAPRRDPILQPVS